MALALLAASSSYCYSDTTYAVTPNAAVNGNTWGMNGVIPDASQPWITIQIGGLAYRYTIDKDPTSDSIVSVRNEDPVNGGYVFEESDDWSGKSGGTVQRYFRFPYIDSTRWGDGSVNVEGDGQLSGVVVTYNYKMDVDDELMMCATTPLADPSCPGFREALDDFLKNMPEPNENDPFYDEWVQANLSLNDEAKEKEEEVVEEPEEKESNFEKQLGGQNTIEKLGSNQDQILIELAQVPKIESYYNVTIQGGVYEETIQLQDTNIPDNKRALRNLASDNTHKSMVRSQYDR